MEPVSVKDSVEEMVVPVVDKKMLEELESTGISTAGATRALHYTGSLAAALDWIMVHKNDEDIDQMPLVPISITVPKPTLTGEEIKIKVQELRERARMKEEEEEKLMEREKDERIHVGKELPKEDNERKRRMSLWKAKKDEEKKTLEKIRQKIEGDKAERMIAENKKKEEEEMRMEREKRIRLDKEPLDEKRIEEDNKRKRIEALGKAKKEEEKKVLEKIRQIIEEDKVERRVRFRLPDPVPVVEEKKISLPIKPPPKAECMRECLRSVKQTHKGDDDGTAKVKRAFETLLAYLGNVKKNRDEEKFRKIRLSNPLFQDRVGNLKGGIEFLELCGFEKVEGGDFLFLLRNNVDIALLNTAGSELTDALNHPFFRVL